MSRFSRLLVEGAVLAHVQRDVVRRESVFSPVSRIINNPSELGDPPCFVFRPADLRSHASFRVYSSKEGRFLPRYSRDNRSRTVQINDASNQLRRSRALIRGLDLRTMISFTSFASFGTGRTL